MTRQIQADGTNYTFAYTSGQGEHIRQTDVTDPQGTIHRTEFNAAGDSVKRTFALGQPEEQTSTTSGNGTRI